MSKEYFESLTMFKLDNLLKTAIDASNEASKAILKERKNLQIW
ncbi:3'(2'),5'-bisphosphate nucleotidase CysQ, partial [Campylobacter jejuni]|nr:3'(2'),5'-bisphosphate nucleotidase CysQ [Campylobacter jejuni]